MTSDSQSYLIKQASCRASLLLATAGLRSAGWEDLRQELVLDCLRRSRNFDPLRGDWHGFVRGVTRNHATVLVMRERRRALEVLHRDLINREDASDADSLDIVDQRPGRAGVVDELHLRLDVQRVVESLPVPLQSLALLLGQMSVQDVCRQVGRSRSRVHQMRKQIRAAFIGAGLTPYIHSTAPTRPKKKAKAG